MANMTPDELLELLLCGNDEAETFAAETIAEIVHNYAEAITSAAPANTPASDNPWSGYFDTDGNWIA